MRQPMKRQAFLGLGANMDDRFGAIQKAILLLKQHPKIEYIRCSSLLMTPAVSTIKQPCFLNGVCKIVTTLSPNQLLKVTQTIEKQLGRTRKGDGGIRMIDIDILAMHAVNIATAELTLPHPRMHQRQFVQVPLQEILD